MGTDLPAGRAPPNPNSFVHLIRRRLPRPRVFALSGFPKWVSFRLGRDSGAIP
jgi:hypothetical protein